METIRTFDELDRKLDECRDAAGRSDDATRGVFRTFRMEFSDGRPGDPFAPEYLRFQMDVYQRVAGRRYSTANEVTPLDVPASILRPFPYPTQSTVTAGQHLGAIGFLLRCMNLPPGARVLEYGPGWGNTTIALARLGFQVTAVDVDASFCAVVAGQAAQLGLAIEVIHDDFFHAERTTDTFDAVLFFECFHHCADHMRLLAALDRIVRPGGRVYFGAEPIVAGYPVPWGVRMDGEALWAIRQNGWLELGFDEGYFRQALFRTGWTGTRHQSADLPWISVWEATRRTRVSARFEAGDERLGSVIGRRTAGGTIVAVGGEAGYCVFGPYLMLGPGRYCGTVHFARDVRLAGQLVMDVCVRRGAKIVAEASVDVDDAQRTGTASLRFTLHALEDDVELRLFCRTGAAAAVQAVSVEQLG